MIKGITLTSSMRSNLLSLKNIATQMSKTQNILSTGKKVNSAIDNAGAYYQARSLTNRASDLNSLLDSMSQGIQTIQTATEGLDNALSLVEQMTSLATQAITYNSAIPPNIIIITSQMSSNEIQALLDKGGLVVLGEDITIDKTLNIGNNVNLIGNRYSINYTGSTKGDSVLKISGNAKISGINIEYNNTSTQGSAITIDGGKAEIDNISINASGYRVYGIQVLNNGVLTLDSAENIKVTGDYSHKLVNGNPDLWDGKYNTDMIVKQIGGYAPAADACKEYYPTDELINDNNFGQGSWYLPSVGEMYYIYDSTYNSFIDRTNKDGVGVIRDDINNALTELEKHGIDTDAFNNHKYYYWTSTDNGTYAAWCTNMDNGITASNSISENRYIRPFKSLEDCFDCNSDNPIAIGDVVYSDLSYGKATDYSVEKVKKTAVGVVCWVSEDKSSAKIISLKDSPEAIKWSTKSTDITEVKDYSRDGIVSEFMSIGKINVTNKETNIQTIIDTKDYQSQYNQVLQSFDDIIDDATYHGVNLLSGNELNITFNQNHTHNLTVKGYDIHSKQLGLNKADWLDIAKIAESMTELQNSIDKLRNFANELGNNLSIIQTRKNFTEALSDVLEVGADKLILADMNEASAEYLMMQTRQQLAVNSLSLASQSASSILGLF